MSHTGLTLKLERKRNILRDANLLILTDSSACLHEIEQVLQAMKIQFHYNSVTCNLYSKALSESQYDLILYNYSHQDNSVCSSESLPDYTNSYPIEELAWWYNSSQQIPLVLITEPLGEERAIACLQSGISGYLLKSKIYNLPQVIEQTLTKVIEHNSKEIAHLLQKEVSQLQEKLSELQKQNTELKTTESNINREYFSHLSHELRSPLANIVQFARMLKDEIYGSLNPKQTEYIAGILTSGNHLSELIDNYLNIAKIDANHEELYQEKVPVEDICEASLVMVQGKAKEKGLELILEIADNIDFCYADSLSLKQILINLLSNAIKFTEQGSVKLQVTIASEILLFSVIDTGIGISEKDSAKLFQPFQQINTHLHRQYKGTGLGLALSRKLAQLHGGDITLTSEVGKGSCFTVSIPRWNQQLSDRG